MSAASPKPSRPRPQCSALGKGIEAAIAIPGWQQRLGLELAASQKPAWSTALSSNSWRDRMVITGVVPGGQQDHLGFNAILRILRPKRLRIFCSAALPGGRKRMGRNHRA